jgi:hypothetical protein
MGAVTDAYVAAISAFEAARTAAQEAADAITDPKSEDSSSLKKNVLLQAVDNYGAALDALHEGCVPTVAGDGPPRDRTLTKLQTFGL